MRGELANGEVFNTLREALALIEDSCRHCSRLRPHSSLGFRPPMREAVPMSRAQSRSRAVRVAMDH
ncbi:integrase core domain-containing protein [Sediminicoccus rosea]|uniref:integrase core domain-containing protein n=1 Tax=Sediminicoccus rosea TaxID=1225128 RepID=UPI00384E5887